MSWDSKSALRRRQNSTAGASRSVPSHVRQATKPVIQPKSSHVADPFLQSFLSPSFDPAEYLNASLPSLQPSTGPLAARNQEGAVPLMELSTHAQTLLSQLNVHTTMLTNTLTQLTDDIVRSGSRLAYEVELLRGETLSLSETLTEGLQGDVSKFVPNGLQGQPTSKANAILQRREPAAAEPTAAEAAGEEGSLQDPAYISQLRTLTLVRARLDLVIKTFGDAMEFVFPPSEVSVSSSFLSVSAPEPGSQEHSTEEKGQKVLKGLREEISSLLAKPGDPIEGIEKAALRIEELKDLTGVWAGTAEEKGRNKFIESLAKMVEDKHRELLKDMEQSGKREGRSEPDQISRKGTPNSDSSVTESKPLAAAYGLMSQLQKLRSGL